MRIAAIDIGTNFPIDLVITRFVQGLEPHAMHLPLNVLNALGFPPLVDIVYGAIIVALFVAGARWEAAAGMFAALGGAGLNHLAKLLVVRPRPSEALVHVEHHIHNSAFPAGHVLNFTAFAGLLCCLALQRLAPSWPRNALVVSLVALIALMGIARIDSGEHWASDVLGGYLLGWMWLVVTLRFYAWGRRKLAFASLALIACSTALPGLAAAAEPAPAGSVDSTLAASHEVPWNPARPLARRSAWEQVVLFPGRLVSLPLSGLGYLTDQTLGYLEQSGKMPTGPTLPRTRTLRPIGIKLAQLGDRTGLGGAVTAQTRLPLHSLLEVEYSASDKFYNRTLATWSGRPFALQYGYEWRPQDRYYGVGTSSSKDSVSDYALQGEFARASARWAWGHDPASARPRWGLGAWAGPRSAVTRTGREHGQLSYDERFPGTAAQTLDRRVEHLVYGASGLADFRAGAPHWSRGWRLWGSAEQFGAPVRALALHTAADNGAAFTRYQLEAETGVSFWRDPRTLRLMAHVTDQQVTARADRFLLSDLATLGGHPGLAGFLPGRYHDLDMLLTRLTYVFPLVHHLEMDLHSEWGAVYPDVWKDARLNSLHSSFGFALHSRSDRSPHGAFGFDFSRENIRLRYTLGAAE